MEISHMDKIARSPKQLGTTIRNFRRNQNITQTQLSAKTSLRQATISKIENGEDAIKIGTLCDVMAALGLELVVRERVRADAKDIEDIF
jgi:HTH-type transcriptional regulator / antitoxin HipB